MQLIKIERFVYDINKTADENLLPILDKYKDNLISVKNNIDDILSSFGINKYILSIIGTIIRYYDLNNSIMYNDELKLISKYMDIPFEKILLMQLCYEMSAACTCVTTKVNGVYTMFRTMDWPMTFLKDITIELEYKDGDNTLFIATTWVGYIGVLTATVPGNFSIAVNYRRASSSFTGIFYNIYNTLMLKWPIGYLIRSILTKKNISNDTIFENLKYAQLIAPCYLSICLSDSKGFIIIRDADKLVMIRTNDFNIQTNIDPNFEGDNILYSIERFNISREKIINNNNNFKTIEDLIKKMYNFPVKNEETIFYNVLQPQNGIHLTYIC